MIATCGRQSSAAPVSTSRASIAAKSVGSGSSFVLAGFAETSEFKFADGDEIVRRERIDLGAAQLGDVAEAAEVAAHVAGKRAHIGALAAFDLEHGLAVLLHLDQVETADLDLARGNVDALAFAGEIVGALAGDLDRRELRRRLHDRRRYISAAMPGFRPRPAAMSEVFVTGPSRSSVERSSPQATVKR